MKKLIASALLAALACGSANAASRAATEKYVNTAISNAVLRASEPVDEYCFCSNGVLYVCKNTYSNGVKYVSQDVYDIHAMTNMATYVGVKVVSSSFSEVTNGTEYAMSRGQDGVVRYANLNVQHLSMIPIVEERVETNIVESTHVTNVSQYAVNRVEIPTLTNRFQVVCNENTFAMDTIDVLVCSNGNPFASFRIKPYRLTLDEVLRTGISLSSIPTNVTTWASSAPIVNRLGSAFYLTKHGVQVSRISVRPSLFSLFVGSAFADEPLPEIPQDILTEFYSSLGILNLPRANLKYWYEFPSVVAYAQSFDPTLEEGHIEPIMLYDPADWANVDLWFSLTAKGAVWPRNISMPLYDEDSEIWITVKTNVKTFDVLVSIFSAIGENVSIPPCAQDWGWVEHKSLCSDGKHSYKHCTCTRCGNYRKPTMVKASDDECVRCTNVDSTFSYDINGNVKEDGAEVCGWSAMDDENGTGLHAVYAQNPEQHGGFFDIESHADEDLYCCCECGFFSTRHKLEHDFPEPSEEAEWTDNGDEKTHWTEVSCQRCGATKKVYEEHKVPQSREEVQPESYVYLNLATHKVTTECEKCTYVGEITEDHLKDAANSPEGDCWCYCNASAPVEVQPVKCHKINSPSYSGCSYPCIYNCGQLYAEDKNGGGMKWFNTTAVSDIKHNYVWRKKLPETDSEYTLKHTCDCTGERQGHYEADGTWDEKKEGKVCEYCGFGKKDDPGGDGNGVCPFLRRGSKRIHGGTNRKPFKWDVSTGFDDECPKCDGSLECDGMSKEVIWDAHTQFLGWSTTGAMVEERNTNRYVVGEFLFPYGINLINTNGLITFRWNTDMWSKMETTKTFTERFKNYDGTITTVTRTEVEETRGDEHFYYQGPYNN